MKAEIICRILLVVFIVSSVSSAKVIYVDPASSDQPDTYTKIQAAIDSAEAGYEIIVHQGTYEENIVITKSITLRAQPGQIVTIAGDPNSPDTMICLVDNADECLLENLVFNPSYSANNTGAGLYGGNVTIRDCKFDSAAAAALSIWGDGQVSIENSVFKNAAHSGIWVSGEQTFVEISNSQFKNNAESGVYFYQGASGKIFDGTFAENGNAGVRGSGPGVSVGR